jgi:hypothetical protein
LCTVLSNIAESYRKSSSCSEKSTLAAFVWLTAPTRNCSRTHPDILPKITPIRQANQQQPAALTTTTFPRITAVNNLLLVAFQVLVKFPEILRMNQTFHERDPPYKGLKTRKAIER